MKKIDVEERNLEENFRLPRFDFNFYRHIGSGSRGSVYKTNKNMAVKIRWGGDVFVFKTDTLSREAQYRNRYIGAKEQLEHEFEVAKRLYEEGVSVPEPKGVFDVLYRGVFPPIFQPFIIGKHVPGFVMQYLPFPTLDKFLYKDFHKNKHKVHELMRRLDIEIERARRIDVVPNDGEVKLDCNILFDEQKDKIYLIDFDHWKIRD